MPNKIELLGSRYLIYRKRNTQNRAEHFSAIFRPCAFGLGKYLNYSRKKILVFLVSVRASLSSVHCWSKSPNPTCCDSDDWVAPVWWTGKLKCMGSGRWCDISSPRRPSLTVPRLGWGARVFLPVPTALPGVAAGSEGMWQPSRPWGTQVHPSGRYPSAPRARKRWISRCNCNVCFSLLLPWAPLPTPEWSPASTSTPRLRPAMRRGQRLPGKAVKCFVHSFSMIRKIGQEDSSHVSLLEDLTIEFSGDRLCISGLIRQNILPFHRKRAKCKELCAHTDTPWRYCGSGSGPSR